MSPASSRNSSKQSQCQQIVPAQKKPKSKYLDRKYGVVASPEPSDSDPENQYRLEITATKDARARWRAKQKLKKRAKEKVKARKETKLVSSFLRQNPDKTPLVQENKLRIHMG